MPATNPRLDQRTGADFHFDTDPFEGSTALTTPGRQIVGGEPFITFDIASDVFSFESPAFNLTQPLTFVNDVVGNVPSAGAGLIVLLERA